MIRNKSILAFNSYKINAFVKPLFHHNINVLYKLLSFILVSIPEYMFMFWTNTSSIFQDIVPMNYNDSDPLIACNPSMYDLFDFEFDFSVENRLI